MTNPHHHFPLQEDSPEGNSFSLGACRSVQALRKMKQKIVVKVDMHCPKCRSKAMEIAAASDGVISVAIEGKEQDLVVVIGEEVDSTCLVKRLRKNVGCTNIVTIEEVKPKAQEKKEEKKDEKKDGKKDEKPRCQPPCHGYPYYVGYEIDEDRSGSMCSIM